MFQYAALLLFSVLLFLYGFFPISNSVAKFRNDPPTHIGNLTIDLSGSYGPHFSKTVLFVIDALRWDFVTPDLMPLTVDLMNRKGCLSKVKVESPTVTLPRIKALTTGSIPQYIDVVRNLASSEILKDSWLHSAKEKGLRTVFYGDNTWEKLFPDFFTRSEGTTSFFVWDFTEVDNNVTRNVNLELERQDWDIMIVHYLGLDHIGHVLGPVSPKMPPKLQEMDEMIYKIYEKTKDSTTLILVTGDHGMRDGGGHGGTTPPEVTVPLVTIGLNCQNSSFLQTDIPANLAVLLGLNIPSTSIGKIQKLLLNNLNHQQYLYALRYNAELLLKKNDVCTETFLNATYFHEKYLNSKDLKYVNIARDLYQNCSDRITRELYEASSRQDMVSLYVAISVMLNVLAMLVLHLLSTKDQRHYVEMCICTCIIIIQFLVPTFHLLSKLFVLLLGIMFILQLKRLMLHMKILIFNNFIHSFLVFTCFLHPITFISTSFIEEEHYYWIYFTVTLILLFMVNLCSQKQGVLKADIIKMFIVLILIRFSMDLNSTIENSVQNTDNWANVLNTQNNRVYFHAFFVLSLALVFFAMNSTKPLKHAHKTLSVLTLSLIFLFKSTSHHNTHLSKLWIIIILQKISDQDYSWKHFWIHASVLLIKPHNIILIPIAVYTGNQICTPNNIKEVPALTVVTYMISNCFYFLQGHRNDLANIDVSVGFTGLSDYYPILVICQLLIHTYSFQVLCHLTVLPSILTIKEKKMFWMVLLALRTSVVMFTSLMIIIFRHHLFIWSVFAPKIVIESVHTAFLFIEICFWYGNSFVKRLFFKVKSQPSLIE